MDTQIVKDLIREFKAADLTKFSLKYEGLEISLERENNKVQEPMNQQNVGNEKVGNLSEDKGNSTVTSDNISGNNETKVVLNGTVNNSNVIGNGQAIKSPMVGTFYASSTPDGAPFVTVGSKVKKGDCICIIEAMKLMNEIEADADGEILEVLIKNEEMVEFDQPLFVIG